jgi:hypothetical protein
MKLISFYVLIIIVGCCGLTRKAESNSKSSLRELDTPNKSVDSTKYSYSYEDKKCVHLIEISYLTDDSLSFMFYSLNRTNGIENEIRGIAVAVDEDYEIDLNDKGYAYPSKQYIFDDVCFIELRIEVGNDNQRLKIKIAECEQIEVSNYRDITMFKESN